MTSMSRKADLVALTQEVSQQLAAAGQVVGLESVAFAHGFSRGIGVELAVECMDRVRDAGAVPGLIFVSDEQVHIESDAARASAFLERPQIRKLGTRDIADAIVRGDSGALTIGATAALCDHVGIRVMSTGGLGGVHLGFAESLDISADLYDVAAANVVVVSAGVKPVLDVAATFEVLETLGVPLLGWQTNEAPMFYSRTSGHRTSTRVEDASEIASYAFAHWSLGLGGGVLVLRPPTTEVKIDHALAKGLQEAQRQGIRGQDVTPFLLGWLDDETHGTTVAPHRELLVNNAELAARVAVRMPSSSRSVSATPGHPSGEHTDREF